MGRHEREHGDGARRAGMRPVTLVIIAALLATAATAPVTPARGGTVVLGGAPAGTAGGGPAPLTTTITYTDTGREQLFIVPAGVTRLHVVAVGAGGHSDSGTGGRGGVVAATLPVTAGLRLYIEVDDAGGLAGEAGGGVDVDGGRGGAASDIRTCAVAATACHGLASRLLVAAGGGGGGASGTAGDTGGAGVAAGAPGPGIGGGRPGTATHGGAAGAGSYSDDEYKGSFGRGGYRSSYEHGEDTGGGGGGGYYGGGGGGPGGDGGAPAGGGGGGSDYIARGAADRATGLAPRGMPPSVTLSYRQSPATRPAGGGAATAALTTTVTYTVTGRAQRVVVPAGVTRLHVVAVGGRGGGVDGYAGEAGERGRRSPPTCA